MQELEKIKHLKNEESKRKKKLQKESGEMNGPRKKLSLFDYQSGNSSSDSIDNGFDIK
jgi:hypothetical protein